MCDFHNVIPLSLIYCFIYFCPVFKDYHLILIGEGVLVCFHVFVLLEGWMMRAASQAPLWVRLCDLCGMFCVRSSLRGTLCELSGTMD